ncbi:MAG: DEAD/DEAH box helicase [Spirochaetes bacterium]|nr:DEAD/DEAH box helicase [Spirochaetota bacterium]
MDFTELNLNKNLLKGIKEAGFIECTAVQEATFAQTLNKKDVCVQSQTGTGKTGAFLISIFQLLLEDTGFKNKKTLIVAPTRELAVQIEKEAKIIGKYLHFSIGCFYGGVGYTEQEKILKDGIDIIIGTPGRLIDFSEQEKINFREIGFLIIDEADRLFDMGFLPDLQRIIVNMPSGFDRITMLFSATLNTRVRDLAWKYMNDPAEIQISPETIVVDKITQELYHVGKNEKIKLLLGIFKKEQPKNALIFTNMKRTAHEVCRRLEFNGIKCQYIMGDLPQSKRLKIIEKVKSGKIKFLVATEVAARGLHIDDLDLVVNYDLPEDCENYVHRIGRTARAGKSGKAISLACEKYVYGLEAIEAFTKYKIPVKKADDDMFVEDKSAGIHFSLEKAAREETLRQGPPHKASRPAHAKKSQTLKEPNVRKKLKARHEKSGSIRPVDDNIESYKNISHETRKKHKETIIREKAETVFSAKNERKNIFKKFLSFLSTKANKKNQTNFKQKVKADKKGTVQERMEYYRKKYGASFIPSPELLAKENNKKRR